MTNPLVPKDQIRKETLERVKSRTLLLQMPPGSRSPYGARFLIGLWREIITTLPTNDLLLVASWAEGQGERASKLVTGVSAYRTASSASGVYTTKTFKRLRERGGLDTAIALRSITDSLERATTTDPKMDKATANNGTQKLNQGQRVKEVEEIWANAFELVNLARSKPELREFLTLMARHHTGSVQELEYLHHDVNAPTPH